MTTESFKRRSADNDIANAFLEGWHAACNLHLFEQEGPVFHVAWLQSEAFSHLPATAQKQDRWAAVTPGDRQ